MALMLVKFNTPITGEPWPGGTETWSAKEHGQTAKVPVTCEDKGTHMLLSWQGGGTGAFAGKRCRIKVPLTNIAHVFEVDEGEEKKK